MAVASGRIAAPAAFAPASRWRGKPAQVGAIVGLWLVAYFLLKGQDLGWPASLTWEELPRKLDDAQDWLLEQRTADNPNPVFALLEGFRSLCEWLVRNKRREWSDYQSTVSEFERRRFLRQL